MEDIQRLVEEKNKITYKISVLTNQLACASTFFSRETDENKKIQIQNDINKIRIEISGLETRLGEIDSILKAQKHAATKISSVEPAEPANE